MRYAAYIRVSTEDQAGTFSMDAQRRAIEAWVTQQQGELVRIYSEAESGRTTHRPEFQNMRRDAQKGMFDAVIVYKFDRFARNRADALATKSLLRREYGVKVFSVIEPSEDSDGNAGALIEELVDSAADWYSRNLSTETTKGKRERALQGYHNNRPPFGFNKTPEGVLYPNKDELPGLILAFELYATGRYSDNLIAMELNKRGYRAKTGNPFSTDTIRDILRNRIYLGYVKYQQYHEHENGSRSHEKPLEWIEGKHQAVISIELFERCQEIRAYRKRVSASPKPNVYLLNGLIYCAYCMERSITVTHRRAYGKMRAHPNTYGRHKYYRCHAGDWGYECPQGGIQVNEIEHQVIVILGLMRLSSQDSNRLIHVITDTLMDWDVEKRIQNIKNLMNRMDFRWDQGFITNQDEYLEKRLKLQSELDLLKPAVQSAEEYAVTLVGDFNGYWESIKKDSGKQKDALRLIIEQVWVRNKKIDKLILKSGFQLKPD